MTDNEINLKLDKIYEAWEKATGKSISDNRIRISSNADWLRYEAQESLKTDTSGLLTSILLKGAFKNLIKEYSLTIEDLLFHRTEAFTIIENFSKLFDVIEESEATDLYNKLICKVIELSEILGKPIGLKSINEFIDSEKTFADAIKDFNNDYKIIKDRFQNGGSLNSLGKILPKLFKFEHYKQFVNALKDTNQDNFICIALIDRTVEVAKEVYDEKYDKFFAIGIKNNNNVWVISDRKVTDSPEAYAHSRNPGRDYENKLNYSHLPYHKFNEIYNNTPIDKLLLTDGTNNAIAECFDVEAILYLGTILMLAYNKYFTNSEYIEPSPLVYFTSDVKFLSSTECKALKTLDDSTIEIPDSNTTFNEYSGDSNLFNTGVFDCWLNEYPLDESNLNNLSLSNNIIANKETMKNYAWWIIRKKQANNIEQELGSNYCDKAREIRQLVGEKLYANAENILNVMLTEPERKGIDNYEYSCKTFGTMPEDNESDRPVLWVEYSKGNDLDLYDIKHSHDYDNFDTSSRWYYDSADSKFINTAFGKVKFINNKGYCTATFVDDVNTRKSRIKLTLRSTYDLERFLNVSKKELPTPLKHYLYSRVDSCSRWGWKPYSGNSILNLTDPMNGIRNPFEDFEISITLALSKKKYNEIIKSMKQKEI